MKRLLIFTLALVVMFGWHRAPATAATADVGYRDFHFGASCNATPTGEKPESKLWWNDGFWWGSLCSSGDSTYHIFRLDLATQLWVDTGTPLDDRPSSRADTLWDGQKLYVASHIFTTRGAPSASPSEWGRLYRYSYNPATRSYSLDGGFPVDVTRGRSETLVLEKALNGQLWVTYVEDGKVMVNHSIGSDTIWDTPFVLPVSGGSNLANDDISSIITFDRSTVTPQIGIMWSNQNEKKVYFASHADNTATTSWNSFGVAAPSNGSDAPADDHINIKLQSDGQGIYAVTKTSNSRATEPLIMLLSCRLVCSSASNWQATPVYTRNENHTRAMLLLDTTHRKINIFSTAPESGGTIYRAVFDMDTLSSTSVPESKTIFMKNSPDTRLNNATSTKQTVNSTTGLVVLASDRSTRFYLHNYDALADAPPAAPPSPAPVLETQIFLPLMVRQGLPDVVGSISVIPQKLSFEAGEPVQASVTISNIGTAASEPAWVDLYINPSVPPTRPGIPWNTICGLQPCFGLVWIVPALEPGQSITLTSAADSYAPSYSIWPGWFARGTTDLYLYVDSWNPGVSAGAIRESNESNNRAEQHGFEVQGANPAWELGRITDLPARQLP